MLLALLLKGRRFWLACLLAGLAVSAYHSCRKEYRDASVRWKRSWKAIRKTPAGSRRQEAVQFALEDIAKNPFGGGWAYAGWVHSDFLQVSANLGLAAGIFLLCGYLYTLFRLGTRLAVHATSANRPSGWLLLSFLVVGQMLAVQGVEFHSFTILPLWLVWAVTEVWLVQTEPAVAGAAARRSKGWPSAFRSFRA